MPTDGWYKNYRSLFTHPLFAGDAFCRGHAFNDLVGMAEFEPATRGIKGHTVRLERGELVVSVRFLAERWGWSKGKVQRFMARLGAEKMVIEVRSETVPSSGTVIGTVYRVVNYATYQDAPDGERDGKRDTSGTPAGQIERKEELTTSPPPTSKDARENAKPADTDLERLRVYLGDHSRAVDMMLASADHPATWPAIVMGKFGPTGTLLTLLRGIPTDRWSAVLANALYDFAGERTIFKNNHFDGFVRTAATKERNGTEDQRPEREAAREAPAARKAAGKFDHLIQRGDQRAAG